MSKDQQAASNMISIVTSIQELISRLTNGHGQPPATYHSALDRAWTILLDLDTRLEELPDEVDRPKSNLAAIAQACSDLSQQHKTADAVSLQQLAQQWLRASHYVSRQGHAAGPANQKISTDSETSSHALSAVTLSENEAVLLLLLGLQGTRPSGQPTLASLPALGSSLLRSLQEEGQAAAAAAVATTTATAHTGRAGWVPMSAQPEELLLQEQRSRTCSEMQQGPPQPCSSSANSSSTRDASQQQRANAAAAAGPWVSPAAAAMQLLQHVPLNAAAAVNTLTPTGQQHGSEPPDDILIAAACAPGDSAAVTMPAAPPQDTAMPAPLLQTLGQQMQLASSAGCLGLPLGLCSSLGSTSSLGNALGKAAGASHNVGVGSMGPAASRTSTSPCYSGADHRNNTAGLAAGARAAVQQDEGVSAAAAEAAAAAQAAAAVRPAVASLMKLSSAEPGSGSSRLSRPEEARDSSNTESAIAEGSVKRKAAPLQQSDTKTARDVSRATSYQQRQQQPLNLAASAPSGTSRSSSSSSSPQELESELVSTACLALQGVWTAVQQLWELVLQGAMRERSNPDAGRVPGQGLSAVQCRLLVQVLHTAELRLRLQAFLQQFQLSHSSDWTTSTHRPGDSSNSSSDGQGQQELCALPVQLAFMNAVRVVLAEHDASLATAQQHKLQGARQQQPSTLLQLLTVHRGMLRQLQQLAELCWCTVQEFVDKNLFLKTTSDDEFSNKKKPSPPPKTSSSSSALSWHILQQARRDKQDVVAAAAALQGAALVAYSQALPWPGQLEGAAAVHMWWAPSTWQLKRGFLGGHALLEQLYEGVLHAGPEATPLLRHLFAAAVQPVLLSLRSWAFMPDTVAAEAAAEATAMSSFTAGAQLADSRALLLAAVPCDGGSAQHLAPSAAGALTAASSGYGLFAQATAAGTSAAALGAGSSSGSSRPWSGSKGAEAAMRHCLQQAWHSIRERAPACPGFLAHVQQPAGVAGMQLHLLQLLGGPGQRLADRLGWLTELEQQEEQEVLTGCAGAPGNSSGASRSVDPAAAGLSRLGAFMGLLCSSSAGVGVGAGEQAAGASSPLCSLSSQQLEQCAAIAADYDAARQAELQALLQDLAAHRAAGQAAHELWLACRQEERREAAQARIRLETEAAARRKQRQQQLLTQQQEQIALVEARRLGARLDQLAMERQLLQQSALQEHQQALLQLQDELTRLHGGGSQPPAADSTAAGATGATGSSTAAAAAAESTAQPPKASRCLISSFAAAAASAAAVLDDMVDPSSVVLSVPGAIDTHATAAGDVPSFEGSADEQTTLATGARAGDADTQNGVQQQQQRRERGTWGQPLRSIAPAAGMPSGQGASAPLAVIGSALTQPEPVQAAGRRSNSQPKVLPGMGRPVSLSRRNSSSDDTGMDSCVAAGGGSTPASGGGTSLAAGRASRSSGMGGVSSILGGFGAVAVAVAGPGKAHQGLQAKGKWGVPIVPVPAAGLASNLQRRASTGALQGLDGISSISGSETPICGSGTDVGQVQHKSQLQWRPSGGLGYSSGAMASGSRPGTPQRARRLSEHLTGAESSVSARQQQQQQHLQWQHSWHHMQQQLLLLQSPAPGGPCSVAGGGVQAIAPSAAAGAAASTGWLMSRHQLRPENQGNMMLLDWVIQQSGVSTTDDAADDAAAAAAAGSTDSAAAAANAAEGNQLRSGKSRKAGSGNQAAASSKPQQDGTQAAAAAPLIATLEVLVVQPLLAQQRLTTHACWNLLLHEHRLLQRMNAIQGLFFQQQGDWVVLLCEGLQPLLQQHHHQHQQKEQVSGAAAGSGSVDGAPASAASISPVVLQLLLESSVQQSCLAGVAEAEKMSLQVEAGRALPGWGTTWSPSRRGSKEQQAAAAAVAAAAATDCLRLSYDVPWPLSLLLGESQLQQYGDIFSVLLRLRQLQQQLMKQWQPLNSRASRGGSSSSRSSRRRGMQRHASEYGAPRHRTSSSGVEVDKRRYTWHGAPQQQLGVCEEEAAAAEEEGTAAAAAAAEGLSRLQDLRLWHAVALHCIDSLLGYMLGELSGQMQVRFEAAVGSQPVSLPVMLEAHTGLLAAARTVCLLPPAEHQQHHGDQQQVTAGSLAGAVYALVNTAWQLQQHISGLLWMRDAAGTAAAGVAGTSSSCGPVLAKAASGFKEGESCTAIALQLAGEADELWEAVEAAGLHMEDLLADLKRRLKSNVAAAVGHPLAGLAARLGVQY